MFAIDLLQYNAYVIDACNEVILLTYFTLLKHPSAYVSTCTFIWEGDFLGDFVLLLYEMCLSYHYRDVLFYTFYFSN